jgi:hypothetical protein
MGGILVLVLSLTAAAPPDKPDAPAEQYQAILKEFGQAANASWNATTDEERNQTAARMEPLPLRLLELAEKNPKEPWTLDALTQVVTQEYWLDNYSSHPGWGKGSRQGRAPLFLATALTDLTGQLAPRAVARHEVERSSLRLDRRPRQRIRVQKSQGTNGQGENELAFVRVSRGDQRQMEPQHAELLRPRFQGYDPSQMGRRPRRKSHRHGSREAD